MPVGLGAPGQPGIQDSHHGEVEAAVAGAQAAGSQLPRRRVPARRLRRETGDREALKRIRSDAGEGRVFTREELSEAWGISE